MGLVNGEDHLIYTGRSSCADGGSGVLENSIQVTPKVKLGFLTKCVVRFLLSFDEVEDVGSRL